MADTVIDDLGPWLRAAVNSGQRHALPAGLTDYRAAVLLENGGLLVTVYGPARDGGEAPPLVTFGVAKRRRQGRDLWAMMVAQHGARPGTRMPGEPWCAVALHPALALDPEADAWLGDFERCVAWTWIEQRGALKTKNGHRNMLIENSGRSIASTDYWQSEAARAGYCYLSWNAGAARLLVPDACKHFLPEMRAAKYVIVSRGPWRDQGGRDALELLFEDDSDSPFCLHLVAEQTDRLLPEDNQGGGFVVTAWTREGEEFSLPGRYRVVAEIPCLEPWAVQ